MCLGIWSEHVKFKVYIKFTNIKNRRCIQPFSWNNHLFWILSLSISQHQKETLVHINVMFLRWKTSSRNCFLSSKKDRLVLARVIPVSDSPIMYYFLKIRHTPKDKADLSWFEKATHLVSHLLNTSKFLATFPFV